MTNKQSFPGTISGITLQQFEDVIEIAQRNAKEKWEILLSVRADMAFQAGLDAAKRTRALGYCPNEDNDPEGWSSWHSSYNEQMNVIARNDGVLAVCLEAFGLDYHDVQNVIMHALYKKEIK